MPGGRSNGVGLPAKRGMGVGGVGLVLEVQHHYVRVLLDQPFRACAVRGESNIQPEVEVVFCRGVEEPVKNVEIVFPGCGLHPVPEAEAADDIETGLAYPRKVLVPHFGFGCGSAVIFDADGKRHSGDSEGV